MGSAAIAGRYLIADRIGVGAMGSVWRAWDLRERRWVAAKVLSRYDAGLLQRFVREQSLRIDHPHVVLPTGWAADDDRVLFTMDLVRGGTVGELLRRTPLLPGDFAAVLLDQLLDALAVVHAVGVVHRDVKPANLLLEPTGTGRPWLRLGDFGVAVVRGDVRLTRGPGGVGTSGYMAPEQAAGAPPDPRQDLYAVGMVARQLVTGRPPDHLATVDGRLAPLVASLTAEDPALRPATALDARTALHASGVPAGAPWQSHPHPPEVPDLLGEPPLPSTWRSWAGPSRRHTAGFAGAACLGALAAWLVR